MAKKFDYRLLVIGGGRAGYAAALSAAQNCREPKQVALVDDSALYPTAAFPDPLGTTSTRALQLTTDLAHHAVRLGAYTTHPPQLDFDQFLAAQKARALDTQRTLKKELLAAGVDYLVGTARFVNPYEVIIEHPKTDDLRHSAARFLLATGSEPNLTTIKLAKGLGYLTPRNFYTVKPPQEVCVIGAGARGCEIAQYFATLGSKVVLLEAADRLLPQADAEVSFVLKAIFQRQPRLKVVTGAKVLAAARQNGQTKLLIRYRGQDKTIPVGTLVLATGSSPRLDCALENAQISRFSGGVRVDRALQTTCRHTWAAGSCMSQPTSLAQAYYEGRLAAANALTHGRELISYAGFARTVRTFPQVVSLGLTENDCLAANRRNFRKAIVPLSQTLAASVQGTKTGFVKLLCDRNGLLLGASLVAPDAELLAQEIAFALRHELTAIELASTPHPKLAYSAALQACARQLLTAQ